MTTTKRKRAWFGHSVELTPFRYEIEGALEVIVQTMQVPPSPWSLRVYDSFSFAVAPMHPEQREHAFTLTLRDTDARMSRAQGRVFQISETTCIMEGTIEVTWQPLYQSIIAAIFVSIVMMLVGVAVSANALCVGLLILGVFYGFVISSHPSSNQDRLVKILEGIAGSVHEMRNPYRLVAESPYPKQSPKHSRPSSQREKVERSKPFIQRIDLRDTLEDDEKTKRKRG